MNRQTKDIWVAVHVERGFVSEIRAYPEKEAAKRQERAWRQKMNRDYDETALAGVRLEKTSSARR